MSPGFFTSRWIEPLDHVTELDGVGLAPGFRAAGVSGGIKAGAIPDVGLLVSSAPETTSAARFTATGVPAPPVLLCTERCQLAAVRAVVVNSGNANAATGRAGFENAAKMQGAAAMVAGVSEEQRRGRLDRSDRRSAPDGSRQRGNPRGRPPALRPTGTRPSRRAIQTTDAFEKRARLRVTAALRPGHADRPGQGSGHDLAPVRHSALLRPD